MSAGSLTANVAKQTPCTENYQQAKTLKTITVDSCLANQLPAELRMRPPTSMSLVFYSKSSDSVQLGVQAVAIALLQQKCKMH